MAVLMYRSILKTFPLSSLRLKEKKKKAFEQIKMKHCTDAMQSRFMQLNYRLPFISRYWREGVTAAAHHSVHTTHSTMKPIVSNSRHSAFHFAS